MAVGVVEQLEMVDVDHQHADGVARPPAPGQQPAELVEVAAVRQAGQRIGRGAGLRVTMRVGARQRGRGLVGGSAEQPARGRRPGVAGPVRQHDRADHAVVRGQRRGQRPMQAVDAADPGGDPVGHELALATGPKRRRQPAASGAAGGRSAKSPREIGPCSPTPTDQPLEPGASVRSRPPPAGRPRPSPAPGPTRARRPGRPRRPDPRDRRSAGGSSNRGRPAGR